MAIIKRTQATNKGSGASNTFASLLTVTQYGGDVLVASVSCQDSNHGNLPVAAIRWGGADGQAFTRVAYAEPSDNVRAEIWILTNPDAGTKDLYIATYGPIWKGVVVSHFSGAKQTTAILSATATGNNNTPSVNILVTNTEAIIVDSVSAEAGFSAYGAGQTGLGNNQGQSFENVIASYEAANGASQITMSETLTSGQPWAIVAAQLEPIVDQAAVTVKTKKFLYKVYSSVGTYLTTWTDVLSLPRFSEYINDGISELTVELGRNSLNFGEESDVKYGNALKLYCIDSENGLTGGTLIYQGFLSRYEPAMRGREETLRFTFLSFWQRTAAVILEGTGSGIDTAVYSNGYNANLLGNMTANNAPSPLVASASTEYASDHAAWKAFDGVMDAASSTTVYPWAASTNTGWLKIDFGSGITKTVRKYNIVGRGNALPTQNPKGWQFEGSNDNSNWTVLDTRANQTDWEEMEVRSYEVANDTAYRYYRLNITANNGATLVAVYELQLFEGVAYSRSGATTVRYVAQKPSDIMKDLLDKFTAAGEVLDYSAGTVDDTGGSVNVLFECATYQEAVKKVVDLCDVDWYFRVGADNIVYLKQKAATANHNLILGQHIMEYAPEKRTDNIINTIYFFGKLMATGERLYKKYSHSASVTAYGRYAKKMSIDGIDQVATMNTIAERVLDTFDAPEVRVVVKVLDSNNEQGKGYDIESIKVGDTVRILNATSQSENRWDSSVWDTSNWDYDTTNAAGTLLQVMKKEYSPDYCVLELSNRQPDIARRVEELNNRVLSVATQDQPVTPN